MKSRGLSFIEVIGANAVIVAAAHARHRAWLRNRIFFNAMVELNVMQNEFEYRSIAMRY